MVETTKPVQKQITFVCISDTHGLTDNLILPEGDVLIHAGDFTNVGSPDDVEKFNDYLKKQNFKYKIVIAGNHDITFDEENFEQLQKAFHVKSKKNHKIDPKYSKSLLKDCIYLEDSSVEVFGYKIYGSPWQIEFCGWAFNLPAGEKLKEKWDKIPSDTDILITHGPPYNILDKCRSGFRAGCQNLAQQIKERIKPKAHIFGHIHEDYGQFKDESTNTLYINASTCTLKYIPSNKPIVFTLPTISVIVPDKNLKLDQNNPVIVPEKNLKLDLNKNQT